LGLLFAILIGAITATSVVLIYYAGGQMPPVLSDAAQAVDAQLFLTLATIGVAFVLAQGLLAWFVWRYRGRAGRTARYVHGNNRLELGSAVVVGVVFVSLAIMGSRVWAQLHLSQPAPDTLVIEVTGEQFVWNARYAGPDGVFGRTDPKLYDLQSNPLGLVPDDPAGRDDVVVRNTVAVPVGRPIELRLGSKDVLHSFFVPALRIKQDTVPGLRIPLRFVAKHTGSYEVPCAQLCGLAHYQMKGTLRVLEPAEFAAWLVEQKAE
jgi:cytochrome c oxidase subunit 2